MIDPFPRRSTPSGPFPLLSKEDWTDSEKRDYFHLFAFAAASLAAFHGQVNDSYLREFDDFLQGLCRTNRRLLEKRSISVFQYASLQLIEGVLKSLRADCTVADDTRSAALLPAVLNLYGRAGLTTADLISIDSGMQAWRTGMMSVGIDKPVVDAITLPLPNPPDYETPRLVDIGRWVVYRLSPMGLNHVLRNVVTEAYSSYSTYVTAARDQSDGMEVWVRTLEDVMAHSYLPELIPVDEPDPNVPLNHPPGIIIVDTSTWGGQFRSGIHTRVNPKLARVFDEAGLDALREEARRAAEAFAEALVVLLNPEQSIDHVRESVFDRASSDGPLAARQLLRFHFRSKLAIPRYVFDSLEHQLQNMANP